jgi:hypothetical protein
MSVYPGLIRIQETSMSPQLAKIVAALGPNSPSPLIGWTIYIMAVLVMIGMMLQKKSNNTVTLLLAGIILALLVDKIGVLPRSSFGLYIVRIYIFVAPIFVVGMSKWPKSRPPLMLAAVIAFFYMFLRWFFEMRGV